jgi:uncharacterized protein YaiE (UPF0345 family)
MAKKKISELPAGGALNGTELVPIVQTGTTKRITAQDIANLGNASGVEGSGTINRLPKFTASSTIGNSAFFDDGTNQGTETTTAINRFIMSANASIAKIFSFRSGNLPRWAFRVDGTESGANAGADLAIRRYNDAGTFIDAPLSIDRSTGVSTFNSGTLNQNTQIFGNKVGMSRTSDGAEVVYFSKNTDLGTEGTANINGYDGIQFRTQGAESVKMTIKSNGEAVFNGNDINIRSASGSGNYLFFTESSVADRYLIGSPAGSGDLVFRSGAYNFSTGTETMRITSAGNVGIGTTSPSRTLSVNGQIGLSDDLISTNGSNVLRLGYNSYYGSSGFNLTTENSIPLTFGTASTERMRILSDGTVCVGRTTNAAAGWQMAVKNGLTITDGTSEVQIFSYFGAGIGTFTNHDFAFRTNNTERMRLFSDGNLALGSATNAGYKLDVNGTARVGASGESLVLSNAGDNWIAIKRGSNFNNIGMDVNGAFYNTNQAHKFYVQNGVLNVMTIKSTGVINITSLPTSPVGLSSGDIWNDGGTLKIV